MSLPTTHSEGLGGDEEAGGRMCGIEGGGGGSGGGFLHIK